MQQKFRFSLGLLIFALLFFYLGVRVYFAFFHVGSYDGWSGKWEGVGTPVIITGVDPDGAMAALQAGDQVLAINGISPNQDPTILNFADRVPPGTSYTMTMRRNGQAFTVSLITKPRTQPRYSNGEKLFLLIYSIFLLTGLTVFLLKPDDKQAWLLAMMLGLFTALNQWPMPVIVLGQVVEHLAALINLLGLWTLPLLLRFFLNFPDRSPLLRRWPRLESWLNWPMYLIILPGFGGSRFPGYLRGWYFSQDWVVWLSQNVWSKLSFPILIAYLAGGLICLAINYRAANQDARRRLRVIMFGSGLGFLTLILVIIGESFNLQNRMRGAGEFMQISMLITAPLIPLSFAYAIIRHKVIPVSLIIRRGVRYLLVSRGAVILEFLTVLVVLTIVLRMIMIYFQASHLVVGLVSGIVSVAVWQGTRAIHNRYLAPMIDRKFFRQSYDAQQIMAELSESLRTSTNRTQLPQLVATKIQAALQTERVTILLKDGATNAYNCAYSCDYDPRNLHSTASVNGHQFTSQTELTNRLLASADPLEVEWEGEMARVENVEILSAAETETLRALNSALLLPLKGKAEMSGIISLGARLGDLPFSNEDKRLLLSVSAPMSFALENTRLIEQMIEDARRREELEAENEQRAKELEEARQLQLSMLPKHVPQLPHVEIAAYMKTATEVGGDYYDFHVSSDGTLTIAVGDATGHGLKAGTVVTAMKGLFHTHAHNNELLSVLTQSSHALKAMNLRSLFMALTLVKLHGNELQIASAGMPPALIYHAHTNSVEEVLMRTMPLGSLRNYPYRDEQFHLQVGDVVVLLSDGFPERFNADSEMLGFDKAQEVLQATAQLSAQQIVEQFIRVEEQWAQGFAPNDDITFVVLKVK